MTDVDDEDLISDADLDQQAETPPLHSTPEPAQEPAPQPELGQGEADDQQPEPEPELPEALKGKFVPHGRFHETNQRLKETNERLRLTEERTNRLLAIMQQQVGQQAQASQQQEPDTPPEDPIARIEWLTGKLGTYELREQERTQQTRQQQEWDNYASAVTNRAAQDYQAAMAEDPQIKEMYQFVAASRMGELMATGAMTQAQAEEQLRTEEIQGYGQAYQNGRTMPDVIRALARARGFQPKAPDAPQQGQQPAQITQERRDQHRSLSQMGGRDAPGPMTAKDLAKMSEDEFAKLSDETIKALMKKAS